MRGDVLVIEEHHIRAAGEIVQAVLPKIQSRQDRYILTVAGESGSGKSETARAIADALENQGVKAVVLGQDDYFVLPPKANDAKRREDPAWLGPHLEVRLDLLDQHLKEAVQGQDNLRKPLVDYHENCIEEEVIQLQGVKVVIAEGTYTSLLKHVHSRVFINRNRLDTLAHRQQRNRGAEFGDPFIENVLKVEHKIIAGHKNLADFIITKDFDVIAVEPWDR